MIKTLIAGAALGFLGKKLYDEGKLDAFLARGDRPSGKGAANPSNGAPDTVGTPGQPDLAF